MAAFVEQERPSPASAGRPLAAAAIPIPLQKAKPRTAIRSIIAVGDVAAIALAYLLGSFVRHGNPVFHMQSPTIIAVMVPIFLAVALNLRGYDALAIVDEQVGMTRAARAFVLSAGSVLLVAFLLKAGPEFSRIIFALGSVAAILLLGLSRIVVTRLSRHVLVGNPMNELLLVDGVPPPPPGEAGTLVVDAAACGLRADADDGPSMQRLGECLRNTDRVILSCRPEDRARWTFALRSLDIRSELLMPDLDILAPISVHRHGVQTSLCVVEGPLGLRDRLVKRSFDLLFVGLLLPLLLPVMALIALAIRLDSPGPAFFRQMRIGRGNRPFSIYKFRTMRLESCDPAGARSTARDDQRVTGIGQFLRRTSLDELPQIFNVLRGEMSVVGPRPHAAGSMAEEELFWAIDQRYWHRHAMKPGLTGLAQIRGHRGATLTREDLTRRLQADLEYHGNWSVWRDLAIILATARVMIHKNAF